MSKETLVYVAQYGEYDMPTPIGVFNNLVAAQMAILMSKPSYDTCVEVFDTETGKLVGHYDYILAIYNKDKHMWVTANKWSEFYNV
jgi:hypothetical protein